jgi:hypothetical protein
MATSAGKWPVHELSNPELLMANHNPETSAPGLPVRAAKKIYQGVMVAWDPANSRAEAADPGNTATSIVIGVNVGDTIDNSAGATGDLKVSPKPGIFRLANDGNVTAAHLFKRVRVIDDHTVGVPAGTDADRFAGIAVGLEGTGYVWVLVGGSAAIRGPQTVTLTSTNGTMAAAADDAAVKAEGEKIGDDVRAIHAALVVAGIIAPAA